MLRIFRKARGDLFLGAKGRRYALYATGEVLLVVVGILLALQVNNWNERRIEQRQIARYAIDLVSDLERDIAMVAPIIEQMRKRLEEVAVLQSYTQGKTLGQIANLDLWLITRPFGYRPYQWNRAAMEQMKAAGALQIIENGELVKKITTYEALTRHLDEDYRNDMLLAEAASNARDSVVDVNYPEDEHFRSIANEGSDLPVESKLALWRGNYDGPQLPLLTNNITDVKIMVNKYSKLSAMQPRVDSEIPRLISLAEELIKLLEDEYSIDK